MHKHMYVNVYVIATIQFLVELSVATADTLLEYVTTTTINSDVDVSCT